MLGPLIPCRARVCRCAESRLCGRSCPCSRTRRTPATTATQVRARARESMWCPGACPVRHAACFAFRNAPGTRLPRRLCAECVYVGTSVSAAHRPLHVWSTRLIWRGGACCFPVSCSCGGLVTPEPRRLESARSETHPVITRRLLVQRRDRSLAAPARAGLHGPRLWSALAQMKRRRAAAGGQKKRFGVKLPGRTQ